MAEIKDVDREAAERYWLSFGIGAPESEGAILPITQAFAAHRLAAEKAERERIVAWLDGGGAHAKALAKAIRAREHER